MSPSLPCHDRRCVDMVSWRITPTQVLKRRRMPPYHPSWLACKYFVAEYRPDRAGKGRVTRMKTRYPEPSQVLLQPSPDGETPEPDFANAGNQQQLQQRWHCVGLFTALQDPAVAGFYTAPSCSLRAVGQAILHYENRAEHKTIHQQWPEVLWNRHNFVAACRLRPRLNFRQVVLETIERHVNTIRKMTSRSFGTVLYRRCP